MSFIQDITRKIQPLVKIAAYKKIGGSKLDLVSEVVAPYEMSSLKSNYSNAIKSSKTAGGDGSITNFNHSEPSTATVKLLLDDTTSSTPVSFLLPASFISDRVDTIISKLFEMCHGINGETHQPYYIRLTPLQMPMTGSPSGSFGGFLSNMDVNNDIADLLGNRVKAAVDLSFTECKSADTSDKTIQHSSPDLTHIYQTYAGDKLVNKASDIYGDPRFVHAVAEFNDLNTVRRIKVGGSVKFPPLDR